MILTVTQYDKFLKLQKEWNNLLESSQERDNVFLRHEWFDAWWKAFGSRRQLYIALHYENNELFGIAPFMIFTDFYKIFPYKRLSFIEDPNAPSMNFILREGYEKKILNEFLDFLFDLGKSYWHAAVLNKIPKICSNIDICGQYFSKNNKKFLFRESQNSPYIPTNFEYNSFLESTSKKFRKQLRNKINKLYKTGEIKFELFLELGKNNVYLSEAMNVSSKSWKNAKNTSMSATSERKKFFYNLSKIAAQNGWLRIWLLSLNGKYIATEYHLEYKSKTHAMRGDFDEDYKHFSPGSVLEAHIIEHCFKNNLLEYDFCGLPYGYKVRWTKHLHRRNNLLFYNRNLYSRLIYFMQKYFPMIRKNYLGVLKNSRNV